MLLFVIMLLILVLGLCITEGNARKGFLGVFLSLIYFPLGVILALTKKYK